jgi:hypothetical protein
VVRKPLLKFLSLVFLFLPSTNFFATAKIYDSLQSVEGVAAKGDGCERESCKVNRTSFIQSKKVVPQIYLDIRTEFFRISIVLVTIFYAGRKDGRLLETGFISKTICSNTTTARICTLFDLLPREIRYQENLIYSQDNVIPGSANTPLP